MKKLFKTLMLLMVLALPIAAVAQAEAENQTEPLFHGSISPFGFCLERYLQAAQTPQEIRCR